MDRNREAFRNRFLAYKNGKSVREIYGIPEYQSGKVNYSKWDAANTLSYIIPFIKEKAITLTDAGRATGAKLSTNLLDSLADNAVRAEVPIRTAIGLATKESTLGNPTDDRTAWNLSSAIRELFDGLYPGTVQHINNGTNIVQGDNLINYHKGNINTSVFSDNAEKSVLQEGLEFYKQHPDKYNPGQPGYQKAVETRGNEVMKSPEVKKWYKEWEAKQVKVMRPNPYSLPTIQSTAPKKFGKYTDGKLPRFANGTGEVLNNISEEYAPLMSNVYQPMVADAKQQVAKFAVDDYAYRVQKQHPEVTKELLLGIYNSTPYIGSDSRKGTTVGQYWHGEDDGYGRRVMVYPRSMKSDDPEFNLQDRIQSTVLHESNHLLRDAVLGGKYTDKEREYLETAYPGVPINEAAALNAQIREKLSNAYGNGAVGEKLDATLEKVRKNKGMQNEMMFHLNNLNGYGHADKVNGQWDPKTIDAMINSLMNVASVQTKPSRGLLRAKDGKLPGYEDGKYVDALKAIISPFRYLRNRMYRTVSPSHYNTEQISNFIKGKDRTRYQDPNTEAVYGMYTKQDSVDTLLYGPFFRENNIPYRTVGQDEYGDPVYRVAVKDIIKPSDKRKGAYEFKYPNLPGQYPLAPKGNVGDKKWLHSHTLGGYNKGTSKDKNGVYDYYEDVWDINPFKGYSSKHDGSDLFRIGNKLGLDYFNDIVPWGNPIKIYGTSYQK